MRAQVRRESPAEGRLGKARDSREPETQPGEPVAQEEGPAETPSDAPSTLVVVG